MLKKLSLGAKITGGFVVVALIAVVIGITGYRGMIRAVAAQDKVAADLMPASNALIRMQKVLYIVQKTERSLCVPLTAASELEHQKKGLVKAFEEAEKARKVFTEVSLRDPKASAGISEFNNSWDSWRKAHEKVMSLFGRGSAGERAAMFLESSGPARVAFRNVEGFLDKQIELHEKEADANEKEFNAESRMTKNVTVAVVLLGVAASLVLGIFLSMSTTRSLNRMTAALSEGATQVASASGQLSSSSQGLAEGSSEQAASLEETSSAMEEMSAMTKRNAESAGQAKSLADRVGVSVEKSNASMQGLVTSMAEISKMGEETGKIIKTIDEIAFQTNLLALNAAVEAARAGEAGAGFAVVADEVRNLAQRAAGAAKNTSELIEGTIKKIKDGTVLVEKTNVDFGEVASAVTKVTELVGEISAASSEQSRGIDEVSTAIGQMDKVTQGNAANAEEIASASEEMNAQALSMEEIVRNLDSLVKGEGSASARTSQAAPPARRKVALPVRNAQPAVKTARASLGGGKPAGGNGKYPGGNGKSHPSRSAEELIPMEDKSMAEF